MADDDAWASMFNEMDVSEARKPRRPARSQARLSEVAKDKSQEGVWASTFWSTPTVRGRASPWSFAMSGWR